MLSIPFFGAHRPGDYFQAPIVLETVLDSNEKEGRYKDSQLDA